MPDPRVLILAESCNPNWPSLPVVGYKYARALANVAEVRIVTHIRNRKDIEAARDFFAPIDYIDNEWIASPLYRLATRLRGGSEIGWSTNMIMSYPPYLAFEWQALRMFQTDLQAGKFNIVHRITPMSPTLPSYISGRTRQPFVIGPLNGNLDWPSAFSVEQKRERESLRRLRYLYHYMPFVRSTYKRAACILAAFQHTIRDLRYAEESRVISMPEIGFDPTVFHSEGRVPAFSTERPREFLFVGRLVPYKVPEVAVRAFVASEQLAAHRLRIIGDGPEMPRLQEIVAAADAHERVVFEGNKSQMEVAEAMRRADAFIFPSIRELGAGVVIEAMASGVVCLVTNYGAPGELAADERGVRIPLQPIDGLIVDYRLAMEACLAEPSSHQSMAQRAKRYADELYTWEAKAAFTRRVYDSLLSHEALPTNMPYR